MKILFVCKHNRFRSKVAEALFKKYNKNPKINAESAGTELDVLRLYVSLNVKKALKKFGVGKVDNKPKKLTKAILRRADLIVIVADNVRVRAKNKKIIIWKIPDTSQDNYLGILKRVKIISKNVKNLIKNL